jgi:peptidoglycan/LPS O-acetylase OafA/YrhL
MPMQRIRPLDGLRACAALSVLAFHVGVVTGYADAPGVGRIVSQLKAGVPVFYVISGFVLYLPWARAIRGGRSRPALVSYARRRVARILPAYWLTLSVWLVVLVLAAGAQPSTDWLGNYGLVQIYSVRTYSSGLGPAWSLCVELSFYLALPALGWALWVLAGRVAGSAASRQLTVIGLGSAACVGLRIAVSGSILGVVPDARGVLATALPATFDWFAPGLALAVIAAEWTSNPAAFPRVRRLAATPDSSWLAGLILIAAAIPFTHGEEVVALDSLVAHLMMALGAGLLLLAVAVPECATSSSRVHALLGGPRMVSLGTISYGIFLWNIPVLAVARLVGFGLPISTTLDSPVGLVALVTLTLTGLTATIGLAALSWSLVERPAQRWAERKRRIVSPLEVAQPATASSIAK